MRRSARSDPNYPLPRKIRLVAPSILPFPHPLKLALKLIFLIWLIWFFLLRSAESAPLIFPLLR
jgi:hypothetical protein